MSKRFFLSLVGVFFMQFLVFAYAGDLSESIREIIENPIYYDGKDVVVEGEVEKIKFTESYDGDPYTLFKLYDDENNSVGVYFKGRLSITEGDKVKVFGEFKKEKRYAIFKFRNVIKAKRVEDIG
ncbi:MAG: hypothetical protein KatS3mg078_0573 [Deltaproteobacteria bacterium]|jgi:exonuclease VII large subunit|nr:hypothetical protein HRbin37_00370 [bacterium HR37]GIW46696.1 MAG: hypothetical protein KatS3mg078_0573 [Deltaproteobacteria bacterium]